MPWASDQAHTASGPWQKAGEGFASRSLTTRRRTEAFFGNSGRREHGGSDAQVHAKCADLVVPQVGAEARARRH